MLPAEDSAISLVSFGLQGLILPVEHDRTFKDKPILYRFMEPPLRFRAVFLGDHFKSSSFLCSNLGRPIEKSQPADPSEASSAFDPNSLFIQKYEMKCEANFGEDVTDFIKFDLWDFSVRHSSLHSFASLFRYIP